MVTDSIIKKRTGETREQTCRETERKCVANPYGRNPPHTFFTHPTSKKFFAPGVKLVTLVNTGCVVVAQQKLSSFIELQKKKKNLGLSMNQGPLWLLPQQMPGQ